jgi:hypothetical protein
LFAIARAVGRDRILGEDGQVLAPIVVGPEEPAAHEDPAPRAANPVGPGVEPAP